MSYGQLLRINPQSVTVLRSYAQFLIEVVNHDAKVCTACVVSSTVVMIRWHFVDRRPNSWMKLIVLKITTASATKWQQ